MPTGYIGNKEKFARKSNAKRVAKPSPADHVAWCEAHGAKLVGVNPKTGNFFDTCYTGHWKNEECRIKYGRRDQ